MNYIKDVAEKILQVGIGEEFNIILDNGEYSIYNPFKFTETDLVNNGGIRNNYIYTIITGDYKIEKIPFVPKMGESYWTYYNNNLEIYIEAYCWNDNYFDKERKLLGIVFRTKQDASDYLPTWKKRLEGEEC